METLLLLLRLFPVLLAAIQAIETSAPVPGAGAAKLQLLTTTVKSGFAAGEFGTHMISPDQFLIWLQTITATIVSFYNILGIFKKSK